jgi:hypothetical protein
LPGRRSSDVDGDVIHGQARVAVFAGVLTTFVPVKPG